MTDPNMTIFHNRNDYSTYQLLVVGLITINLGEMYRIMKDCLYDIRFKVK